MSNATGKSDNLPTESETTPTVGNLSHEGRETSATSPTSMEARGLSKENFVPSPLDWTQCRMADYEEPFVARSRGLLGVREAVRKDKCLKFTNLLHHLRPELLRASFFELNKQAAPGVDQQTRHDYAEGIDGRIADRHGRIHRGAYRAQPSKLCWDRFVRVCKQRLPSPRIEHPYPNVRFAVNHPR